MKCLGDTAVFSVLNERASSGVAKMPLSATGGFENYVLTKPVDPTPVDRASRLKWIKRLVEQHDPDVDGKEVGEEIL